MKKLILISLAAGACALALSALFQGPAAGSLDRLPGFLNPETGEPCELWGNAVSGSTKAESNKKKSRYRFPRTKDFYSRRNFLTHILSRQNLTDAQEKRRFKQSKAARMTGYVKEVKFGGIESCNCKNTDDEFRDAHIDVVVDLGDGKEGIVVAEPTPRTKHYVKTVLGGDWSTRNLKEKLTGQKCRFTGWIFYDQDHWDQAFITDPTNTRGRPNFRASNWEIHPVTKIEVWDPVAKTWVNFLS